MERDTTAVGEPERGCYVYGIVRDDRRPMLDDLTGVASTPLDFVRFGALAAVVAGVSRSDFPQDPLTTAGESRWLEAAVRAHEAVLERCLEHGPVLPMRFATTFRTPDDVQQLLDTHHVHFEAVLAQLGGRHEWGVKARLDEAVLVDWVRTQRPDLREAQQALRAQPAGTAYLAQKRLDREVAAAGDAAVHERVAAAHQRLAETSVDSRSLSLPTGEQPPLRTCLNAAYLVDVSGQERFRAAVDALTREHAPVGLRYELSGAWPPYNFVPAAPA